MRALKNLLGDGSKIHANEIAVTPKLLLDEAVIVEKGSNHNGEYIRFGDGSQIVRMRIVYLRDTTYDRTFNLPVTFADDLNTITPTSINSGNTDMRDLSKLIFSINQNNTLRVNINNNFSLGFSGVGYLYVAITIFGRWK